MEVHKSLKAIYCPVDEQPRMVTISYDSDKLGIIRTYVRPEGYMEGYRLGKLSGTGGIEYIYMDECGAINGSKRNCSLPEFYGHLLILAVDDEGEAISTELTVDVLRQEVTAAIARRQKQQEEFLKLFQ